MIQRILIFIVYYIIYRVPFAKYLSYITYITYQNILLLLSLLWILKYNESCVRYHAYMHDVCRKNPMKISFSVMMRWHFIAKQITLSGAGDRSKMAAVFLAPQQPMRRPLFICLCLLFICQSTAADWVSWSCGSVPVNGGRLGEPAGPMSLSARPCHVPVCSTKLWRDAKAICYGSNINNKYDAQIFVVILLK